MKIRTWISSTLIALQFASALSVPIYSAANAKEEYTLYSKEALSKNLKACTRLKVHQVQKTCARSVARAAGVRFAELSEYEFNTWVTELLAEYRLNPAGRRVYGEFLYQMQGFIDQIPVPSKTVRVTSTMLSDLLATIAIGTSLIAIYRGVRGFPEARSAYVNDFRELSFSTRIELSLWAGYTSLPENSILYSRIKTYAMLTATGVTIGATHATIKELYPSHYCDPVRALESLQRALYDETLKSLTSVSDALDGLLLESDQNLLLHTSYLGQLEAQVLEVASSNATLFELAPLLKSEEAISWAWRLEYARQRAVEIYRRLHGLGVYPTPDSTSPPR